MKKLLLFSLLTLSIFSQNINAAEIPQSTEEYSDKFLFDLITDREPDSLGRLKEFIEEYGNLIDWNAPFTFAKIETGTPLSQTIIQPKKFIELITNPIVKDKIDVNNQQLFHPIIFSIASILNDIQNVRLSRLNRIGLSKSEEALYREAFLLLLDRGADLNRLFEPDSKETVLDVITKEMPGVFAIYNAWGKNKQKQKEEKEQKEEKKE